MAEKERSWRRRLAKVLAATAGLFLLAALAVKWWVAPAILRHEFLRQLPEYWSGRGKIGSVRFAWFGPLELRGLELTDRQGRTWLDDTTVVLHLQDWPSPHPTVWSVDVIGAKATLHVDADGTCRPPWRKVPAELWRKYLDLRIVQLAGAAVEVRGPGRAPQRYESLHADLWWDPARRRAGLGLPWGRRLTVEAVQAEGFVLAADRLEIERLAGRVGEGRIAASLKSRMGPDGLWRGEGRLTAVKLDLARLGLPIRGAEQGVATGLLDLRLEAWDANGLTGSGMGFVKDADLRNVPAAAKLLRQAGLARTDALSKADVEFQFRLRGTVAAADGARVALPLAAVDIEPGGTLDLWTGGMDLCAVVLLFEKARAVLKRIPLVGLMVDLSEQFSRLRVRGRWQDADSVVIESAPMAEVTNGSRRFLTDSVGGTAGIGKAILKGLSDPFAPAASTRPASRPAAPGKRNGAGG